MSWRDTLEPASFRGASFGVFDAETLFGRRNQLHEYPLRDEPYAEDLGRKAREFTINAFVIGDDYFGARDALIRAIEDDPTPGTLVHPTLGTKTVIPKECRVVFKNTEGGIEYFSLTFVEAGENSFPSSILDTSFFSQAFATSGLSSFSSFFSSLYTVNSLPDFINTAGLGQVNDFVRKVQNILSFGDSSTDEFSGLSETLGKFSDTAPTDILDAETLGEKVTGTVTGLSDVYLSSSTSNAEAKALAAQKRLFVFGDEYKAVPTTTPERVQQAVNQEQLVGLVKNSAAAEMIRITSIMDYDSRQDAIAVRDDVDSYLQPRLVELADNGDDEPYLALSKARVAMIKDINARAANLKNIKYVQTDDSIPALVFAYDQYEDSTKDAEIVSRNKIRNPVFLPGDSALEVLV